MRIRASVLVAAICSSRCTRVFVASISVCCLEEFRASWIPDVADPTLYPDECEYAVVTVIVPAPPPGVQLPPVTGAASAVSVPATYTMYCAFALFDVSIPNGHGFRWIVLLPAVPRLSAGVWIQFLVAYRALARLFVENYVPAGCTTFWLAAGVVETFPLPTRSLEPVLLSSPLCPRSPHRCIAWVPLVEAPKDFPPT